MPKFNLGTFVKLPDFITLSCIACGMLSIFLASQQYFTWAAILLIAAAISDWLDGQVAALIRRKGRFGAELDSLADAVNFAVAPALFGYFLGLKEVFSMVVLILFTIASIARLARFNVIPKTTDYFIGLPTTYNSYALALLYFIISHTDLPWIYAKWIYLAFYLISAVLMQSTLKFLKVKGLKTKPE